MREFVGNTKKRILVVDDDSVQLELIRAFLEPEYLVGTVNNGRFALEYVRQYKTDLILLDILMPGTDGFKTLKLIKELEEGRNIPVIFITGKNSKEAVLDSINAGVDECLIKPIVKDKLLATVDKVLKTQTNLADKKTVLAVDTDVMCLKRINNSLKETYNIVMVNSSEMAVGYMNTHQPDVILLDYQMPSYEGESMLGYIRSLPAYKDIPVIILTGINNKHVTSECGKDNPNKVLLKPVGKLDLIKSIETAFNT